MELLHCGLLQDRDKIQEVILNCNVDLLRLLASRNGFKAHGLVPHYIMHQLDAQLLQDLLKAGLNVDTRKPNSKTFLLHKVSAGLVRHKPIHCLLASWPASCRW